MGLKNWTMSEYTNIVQFTWCYTWVSAEIPRLNLYVACVAGSMSSTELYFTQNTPMTLSGYSKSSSFNTGPYDKWIVPAYRMNKGSSGQ